MLELLPRVRDRVPGVKPGTIMAIHRYADHLLKGLDLPRERRFIFQRAYYQAGDAKAIIEPGIRADLENADPYGTHLAYFRGMSDASFIDQMLRLDQKTFLPELNLLYSDKTSMAHAVEVRVPLLDDVVVDFMRTVPARHKIHGFGQKLLFKHAMEGILPKDVIWRRKAPFSAPVRTWLRRDLDDMLRDLLSRGAVEARGWLDPTAVETMLRTHREGHEDHSLRIWSLVTLEVWARSFIDCRFPVQGEFA
jgi:asparagine synthase (glutamine-hydrolysing)